MRHEDVELMVERFVTRPVCVVSLRFLRFLLVTGLLQLWLRTHVWGSWIARVKQLCCVTLCLMSYVILFTGDAAGRY